MEFSSPHCPPCQAMKPTLAQLESSGVPVRHVDVVAEASSCRPIRDSPDTDVCRPLGWQRGHSAGRHPVPRRAASGPGHQPVRTPDSHGRDPHRDRRHPCAADPIGPDRIAWRIRSAKRSRRPPRPQPRHLAAKRCQASPLPTPSNGPRGDRPTCGFTMDTAMAREPARSSIPMARKRWC